jgi:spore coat protein U-like protein
MRSSAGVALGVLAALSAGKAAAGQAMGDFTVRMKLNAQCLVEATDIDFGTLTEVTGAETASGQVKVRCSQGTPFTVSYSSVSISAVLNQNMFGVAPFNTDIIPYRLTLAGTSGTGVGLGVANAVIFSVAAQIRGGPANVRPDIYRNNRRVYVTY